ncbi:glutathione peroxidase [Vulcanococcus sp. Clear-D1]|jgi:glutathione peroxidase|uniref:glutathione peroxidase n=1 Tax=Vulcanococcus sp. Clear-D1 TaxID=2766970 RepID=UPI001995D1D6|nr:glutathione peroxidase [Vulcanococcus sp. Clear-D1]MBD1193835.1 glutathione peroxidase [Vulcanococcus sp. Clear-D1]
MAINVSDVVVHTASGAEQKLGELDGQVRLIVNVASRCGFTRQYSGLQALQEAYGSQGFSVLAFPCNDFGAQEPGSVEEIQQFCSTTYGVNFPIYAKVAISAAPFDTLVQAEPAGPVAWNFEKFLVGKDGSVIARFKSGVEPESAELKGAIEAALAA